MNLLSRKLMGSNMSTVQLAGRRASAERKKPNLAGWAFAFCSTNRGAGCRFRTGHLMITNQLLYQMS
jgi:hypothetical protein